MSIKEVKQGCPQSPTLFSLISMYWPTRRVKQGSFRRTWRKTKPFDISYYCLWFMQEMYFWHILSWDSKSLMEHSDLPVMWLGTKSRWYCQYCTILWRGSEVVHSSKYIGVDIPSQHNWNRCLSRRMEAGVAQHSELENICHLNTTQTLEIRAEAFWCTGGAVCGIWSWGLVQQYFNKPMDNKEKIQMKLLHLNLQLRAQPHIL